MRVTDIGIVFNYLLIVKPRVYISVCLLLFLFLLIVVQNKILNVEQSLMKFK